MDPIIEHGCRAPGPLNGCQPQRKHILTRHILILFKTAFFDRKLFHWQIFMQRYLICLPSSHMGMHQNCFKKITVLRVRRSLDCSYQVSRLVLAESERTRWKHHQNWSDPTHKWHTQSNKTDARIKKTSYVYFFIGGLVASGWLAWRLIQLFTWTTLLLETNIITLLRHMSSTDSWRSMCDSRGPPVFSKPCIGAAPTQAALMSPAPPHDSAFGPAAKGCQELLELPKTRLGQQEHQVHVARGGASRLGRGLWESLLNAKVSNVIFFPLQSNYIKMVLR